MIHLAVLIGADIFAALEIEAQQHGNPGIARPGYFAAAVHFV
jgi:hypothetical protein